jgi:hypothetical protein
MCISPRPIRYMSTPTTLPFSIRLPCVSVAHKALVVGDPNSPDGVLTSELRPISDNGVEEETHFHVMLSPAMVAQLNRAAVIGYTYMDNQEILREGS